MQEYTITQKFKAFLDKVFNEIGLKLTHYNFLENKELVEKEACPFVNVDVKSIIPRPSKNKQQYLYDVSLSFVDEKSSLNDNDELKNMDRALSVFNAFRDKIYKHIEKQNEISLSRIFWKKSNAEELSIDNRISFLVHLKFEITQISNF